MPARTSVMICKSDWTCSMADWIASNRKRKLRQKLTAFMRTSERPWLEQDQCANETSRATTSNEYQELPSINLSPFTLCLSSSLYHSFFTHLYRALGLTRGPSRNAKAWTGMETLTNGSPRQRESLQNNRLICN